MGFEHTALVWELCHMLEEGRSISVKETEDNWKTIIEYIKTKFGFCGKHSKGIDWSSTQEQISSQEITETIVEDSGINNNGLVYLLWLLWGLKSTESLDEIIE